MPNTFKRNVLIAFGFSLILLLLSSIASFVSIKNLITTAQRVDHTNNVISELDRINILLQEAESSQRGYLLTGEESFLRPYEANSKEIAEKIANVKQLTADNSSQQQNISRLDYLINQRFSILALGVKSRKEGTLVNNATLIRGKEYMDETNSVITQMEQMENNLHTQRSARFRLLIIYTPIIIILAAFLAILITVFFYGRIIADYRKRAQLQEELERKDFQISQRLSILRDIASKISSGDYKVRLGDEGKDILGNLATTVNKMAESLDYSFTVISDKEWLQTGEAGLTKSMIGEMDILHLSENILHFLVNYTNSNVGAFYLAKDNEELELVSSYALEGNIKKTIKLNEGITGQVSANKKVIVLDKLKEDQYNIRYT